MLEEFFQQGDLERAQGLPVSPMMDRHSTSLSLSQINFTEFIVAPLFHQACTSSPRVTAHDQLRQGLKGALTLAGSVIGQAVDEKCAVTCEWMMADLYRHQVPLAAVAWRAGHRSSMNM